MTSSQSRIHAQTVLDEDESSADDGKYPTDYQDIDNVLESFEKEMDALTRPLDQQVSLRERVAQAKAQRISQTTKPTVTTTPISQDNTTTRETPVTTQNRFFSSPPPVETPAHNRFSHLPDLPTTHDATREEISESPFRFVSRSKNSNADRSESSDWKRGVLDYMRNVLDQQEAAMRCLEQEKTDTKAHYQARVRQLEDENQQLRRALDQTQYDRDALRSELDARENYQSLPRRYQSPSPPRDSRYQQRYPSEPIRTPPRSDRNANSFHSPRFSVRRQERDASYYSEPKRPSGMSRFSPGTRFVAELSKMMDLEVGHHAPLSLIVDRELDRQLTKAPFYYESLKY
jgi:hypothetical protein